MTLGIWADALRSAKDEAIAIQSQEVYDRYTKYLTDIVGFAVPRSSDE